MTVRVRSKFVDPTLFDAVTRYWAAARVAVAVPVIAPVDGFSARPEGNAGCTSYASCVPVTVGANETGTPTTTFTGDV